MIREMLYIIAMSLCLLAPAPAPASVPTATPQVWVAFKAVAPTAWSGSTAYTANGTAPTLIIRKSAGAARSAIKRLDISQSGVVAGGLINCVIKIDSVDRYSSGGNLWLIRAKDTTVPASTQPTFTMFDGATATAENAGGANPRTIFDGTIFQTVTSLGTGFIYDFASEDVLGASSSLLIYLYASGTAPTFNGTVTVYE